MPKKLIPIFSDDQFEELTNLSKNASKPYLRERASAILKLAEGHSATEIATSGLLQSRYYETVSDWFHRFQSEGIKGLEIKSGRGRKAAFSPSVE